MMVARNLLHHVLREAVPVAVKAVIPLRAASSGEGKGKLGVLVVDAGEDSRALQERDFQHLQVLADLMGEVLWNATLMERIKQIQRDKDRMAREVSHIFRNRFTVIGGFARRLLKWPGSTESKRWVEIIQIEVALGEEALEEWRKAHQWGETS